MLRGHTSHNAIQLLERNETFLGCLGVLVDPNARAQSEQFLVCLEVDVVCGVDGLWNTVDFVRHLTAIRTSSQHRGTYVLPGAPRRS